MIILWITKESKKFNKFKMKLSRNKVHSPSIEKVSIKTIIIEYTYYYHFLKLSFNLILLLMASSILFKVKTLCTFEFSILLNNLSGYLSKSLS
jgi:hypothetical protein